MEERIKEMMRMVADAQLAYYKSNAPVDTGALRNSIRAQIEGNEIKIIYNRYGAYQDLGVQGWGTGKNYAPGSPFQFKDRPETGYNNMRIYGIPPQYWATEESTGLPRVTPFAVEILEEEIANAIEQIAVTTTTQRSV